MVICSGTNHREQITVFTLITGHTVHLSFSTILGKFVAKYVPTHVPISNVHFKKEQDQRRIIHQCFLCVLFFKEA